MPDFKNALIVFIKNPEKGKVKTRLATTVGDEKALEIYIQLLAKTKQSILGIEAKVYLYFSEYVDTTEFWQNETYIKKVQIGENLGQRMNAAFVEVLEDSSIEKAIIIGSDCPDLNSFVIGPAYDGGYYLLGMKKPCLRLFEKKIWSGPRVLIDTIADINTMVKTYFLLPPLMDIDTIDDWERYQNR
jgi:uncharacterized protein